MQVGFHGQHHSSRCRYVSLLEGTSSSLFCQNERIKKKKQTQWKGPSSVAGLTPSFSIAEVGSPRPLLWPGCLGPDGAAQGSSLDSLPCAGASSHIQCLGREQGRGSSTVHSGLQAAGTSLPLQSIAYHSGISSCLVRAGGNVYLLVFPTLKLCLRSH